MKELVVGDIHFGIKNNSVEWLEKQCKLFEQITESAVKYNIDRIIFLGDLFDIRYSINQQVAYEVKKSIRNLSTTLKAINSNSYIVFVAGNHDYYSPNEDVSQYNAYQTVFGQEFINSYNNIYFVDECPLYLDDSLFLPWYWTENTDHFDDLLYRYDFGREVKAIYCHADLGVWPGARIASLKGIPVYSGHIHYIVEDEICNLHNIGAACALTFADTNQDRYYYYIEDFIIKEKILNVSTPKFIKLYNDEIFDIKPEIFENSYVQLVISKNNAELASYIDQLKYIRNTFVNANIRVFLTEEIKNQSTDVVNIDLSHNINDYIKNNIPDNLVEKYNLIKSKFNN